MIKKHQIPSCETCRSRLDSVFCLLEEEQLADLSLTKQCNFYVKGQTLFNEGNMPMGLYCINTGKVKLSQEGFEGREQIIRLAKDSDILGYRALISGEVYSATATILEDSRICHIPKQYFYELLQKNSKIASGIMKLLADDLKQAESKITNIAQKPVLERLAETLIMLKEYYGTESDNNYLNINITREEIANIIGTATETVIRLMSDLKKEGMIKLEGKKIRIVKCDELLKLANLYD